MLFTSDAIRARVRQQPFQPFKILTSDGQQYEVRHPDLILVGRREITVGATSNADATTYEHLNRIALMHITAINDLSVPVAGNANGSP